MNEFELINYFFLPQSVTRKDVILGIGDDCAVVKVPPKKTVAITTDTLVAGIHFLSSAASFDIGFKALAVNLSDLAAMGATPAWITLALTLPSADEKWLQEFTKGLMSLATQHNVLLIGGDLTRGPLSITITAYGFLPHNKKLCRHAAKPHDLIYVTHTLGDAALALLFLEKKIDLAKEYQEIILPRLQRPLPRVEIGKKLLTIAHAAIDISDGLLGDLQHILAMSKVGATIYVDQLPLSQALQESVTYEKARALALNGGDDYELCFTIPKKHQHLLDFDCTLIGYITENLGLDLRFKNGDIYQDSTEGYTHFT